MKKAMNQSKLIVILNGISILALLIMVCLLVFNSTVTNRLNKADDDRFNLTYYASQFMNGSVYLTDEVRAYASTGQQEHYDNYWNEVNNPKISLLFVGVMQLLVMRVARKKILNPVISVRDQMKEISCGNLSAEFSLEADSSEIGMLVDSIHETKQELKNRQIRLKNFSARQRN